MDLRLPDGTGGSFGLASSARTFGAENGVPIAAWELATYLPPGVWAIVGDQTGVSSGGQFVAPPGTVYFAPGADGAPQNYGAIRFTVPAAGDGNYVIRTSVRSLFDGTRSRDADFHVMKNGLELFGEFLPPNFATGYTNEIQLASGDTIDFAIGRGADGVAYDTGLKIEASLTLIGGDPAVVGDLPVISSIDPISGPFHHAVTIRGENFGPAVEDNIGYFGAVRAPVVAASPNELMVIVPLGATYAPISVTVDGLTGSAHTPFVTTFPGGGSLGATSLSSRTDLGAGDGPIQAAIGDLDLDGKPDLVVVSGYDNTMNIYRNVGAGAPLSAASFKVSEPLPTGPAPYVVVLADLDGDGRLDVITCNFGNKTAMVNRSWWWRTTAATPFPSCTTPALPA